MDNNVYKIHVYMEGEFKEKIFCYNNCCNSQCLLTYFIINKRTDMNF